MKRWFEAHWGLILNINEHSIAAKRVKAMDEISEKPHRGESMVEMRIIELTKAP